MRRTPWPSVTNGRAIGGPPGAHAGSGLCHRGSPAGQAGRPRPGGKCCGGAPALPPPPTPSPRPRLEPTGRSAGASPGSAAAARPPAARTAPRRLRLRQPPGGASPPRAALVARRGEPAAERA
ncbi:unnamed protein product [Prorocentrum cordatum]|uniref:Uncharacterized protein n=1 Tax=Prorocentrum cordatum TaxID=2364126 RepID=A0ABN9SUP6_9DINO|nr:unnamed protein product [Polarella glacialis]